MLLADLHTHTTASDGEFSPEALVAAAQKANVQLLAITDHDTMAGYKAVKHLSNEQMHIVPSIELSTQVMGMSIHVVGLNVDVDDIPLQQRIDEQLINRKVRALLIAQKLESAGLTGVKRFVESLGDKLVTRPDIAQYLVTSGQVSSIKKAFDRHLGAGKKGDVKQTWPALSEAVQWIVAAGGTAVFAHPEAYKITRTKLRRLLLAFVEAGGTAIELPHDSSDFTQYIIRLAKELSLKISVGSDFHSPKQHWRRLGKVPAIPQSLQPVWDDFSL